MREAEPNATPTARLDRAVRAALLTHAAASPAVETCGILLGRLHFNGVDVVRYLPVRNEADQPARRFRISAATVHAAQDEANRAGLEVIGFAHSHPRGPARPSPADLDPAPPGYLHLIVDTQAAELAAWTLKSDRSGFEPVELIEEGG